MKKKLCRVGGFAALVLLIASVAWGAYTTLIYTDKGGNRQVVASGGEVKVLSGGAVTVDSGGTLTVAGVTVDSSTLAMTGLTATAAELNKNAGMPASMTTTATPATGTCGVQFVFKNAAGSAISRATSGLCYVSSSTGLAFGSAITSLAVLTNGGLATLVTGSVAMFTTDATGKLGVTLTASPGSYYLTFVLPNGSIITSSVLGVN